MFLRIILRSVLTILWSLVLLLVMGFQALAEECSTHQFGVRNVSIDQLADTAGEARELGTRAAAETAFAVVLERLLNDPEKISQFLDRHDLDQFSDFVHITENSLRGRYIALLDFCFDANPPAGNLPQGWSKMDQLPQPSHPCHPGPGRGRMARAHLAA